MWAVKPCSSMVSIFEGCSWALVGRRGNQFPIPKHLWWSRDIICGVQVVGREIKGEEQWVTVLMGIGGAEIWDFSVAWRLSISCRSLGQHPQPGSPPSKPLLVYSHIKSVRFLCSIAFNSVFWSLLASLLGKKQPLPSRCCETLQLSTCQPPFPSPAPQFACRCAPMNLIQYCTP